MKYFLTLLILLLSILSVAQPTVDLQYRYYYNSQVDISDIVYNTSQQYHEEITPVDYSYTSYFGLNTHLPFNCFDLESPLYSHKFSLDASAYFLYDHNHNNFRQQYYDFALNFQLSKKEPIYITNSLSISELIGTPNATTWTGYDYKLGLNYNTINQKLPNIVNFYGELNYFIYGDYYTYNPYGNTFVNTNDIETIIGAIINIKNVLFLEQNSTIYMNHNLFNNFTFVPYYSDFKTIISLKIKKITVDYSHVCFHPFISDNINPHISGNLNSIGLTYKLF